MKIIVTSGGTREPIDRVRYIGNTSTGRTGAVLADNLARRGHAVTYVAGDGAVMAARVARVVRFSSSQDLEAVLRREVGEGCDAVVMAAAVADYRAEQEAAGKIDSGADTLVLRLVRNPKILPRIKSFATTGRPPVVVGFKLTVGADAEEREAAVARQWAAGGVDITVHNDLSEIAGPQNHPYRIYTAPGRVMATVPSAVELARMLGRLFWP